MLVSVSEQVIWKKTLFSDTTVSSKIEDLQSSSCLHITFLSHKQKTPAPVVSQLVPLKSLIRSSYIRTKGEKTKQNKEVKWTPCTPADRKGVSESRRALNTPIRWRQNIALSEHLLKMLWREKAISKLLL